MENHYQEKMDKFYIKIFMEIQLKTKNKNLKISNLNQTIMEIQFQIQMENLYTQIKMENNLPLEQILKENPFQVIMDVLFQLILKEILLHLKKIL